MEEEKTLEGWAPEPDADLPLARIVELAFDYRGNTTVVKRDGTKLYGYVFNCDAEAAVPYLEMFDAEGGGPYRIPFAEVRTIHFTGRDTAAGKSYAAWLARKQAEKAAPVTPESSPRTREGSSSSPPSSWRPVDCSAASRRASGGP
jgi:hypothetical protein